LHFNDADEVSCRAGAIKCSRCRASFAPIRFRNWFPRWLDPVESLSETKNCWKFEIGRGLRQIGQSRTRYYIVDLRC